MIVPWRRTTAVMMTMTMASESASSASASRDDSWISRYPAAAASATMAMTRHHVGGSSVAAPSNRSTSPMNSDTPRLIATAVNR